ncbi:MAG: ATP-binding protein [Bacteroidota bacterium]
MKDIIKRLLYDWKEAKLPEIIKRQITLFDNIQGLPHKIFVITGFRRVGKTFLMYSLIEELLSDLTKTEVVYLNFEDERIPLKTEFLTSLLPTINEIYDEFPKYLFLDEIQNIPNWSKWLRRVYDSNPQMRIFIAGSTSKVSSYEIPTELRGRFIEYQLFPLSFREFLNFKGISIDFEAIPYSDNENVKFSKYFNEIMLNGSMPEIVLSEKQYYHQIIHGYYNTVVRRDIAQRFGIKNEEVLRALLKLLLNTTGYTFNKLFNNLKSLNFKTTIPTLQSYVGYAENAYFLYSLPVFSYKVKDILKHPRKVYFIDNAFINFISIKHSENLGRLFENFIAMNLLRENKDVFYWKSRLGYEVDFVIKDELKVKELIQVCYQIENEEVLNREMRALLQAKEELKCNNLKIITKEKFGFDKMEWFGKKGEIQFIPLWKWLEENK